MNEIDFPFKFECPKARVEHEDISRKLKEIRRLGMQKDLKGSSMSE
jgi:hypothetical protein